MTNEEVIKRLQKMRSDIDKLITDLSDDACEVKVKESDETKAANALFDELWQLYPRKDGRSAVSLTAKKRLLKVGRENMIDAIKVYSATTVGKDPKYILMGSTFFNTRYKDYLGIKPMEKAPIVYENGVAKMEW